MSAQLQLVNAPLQHGYQRSSRTGTYPPLNIASLASYALADHRNLEVELLDGELSGIREIYAALDAEVVGISCNIMSYASALEIAKAACQKGSKVILGGPFPTSMPKTILRNRLYVDAVVVGDGEVALSRYLHGAPPRSIPNFCFREGAEIVQNEESTVGFDGLPQPTYLNLPLHRYFENYEDRYAGYKPFRGSLAIYSRKGCIWRNASNGGCVFCMIPHKGIRYKKPKALWDEIGFFRREHGVDFFWEVSDTFTENSRWIREFVETKPVGLDVSFSVYARASNISRSLAAQLRKLGVYEVFIGAESGDNEILRRMNKGITVDQTSQAVQILTEEGIKVIVSFVLGLPGETSKTLQKTMDFARELSFHESVMETSSSTLLPIPGSNAFEMLMKVPGMLEKHSSDMLNLEGLKLDWVRNFTNTNLTEVEEALDQTLQLFPLNSTFSQREAQPAPMC
jgi:radical SAM superfamily enzyme YgiQ (UPF0313 family)